MAELQGAMTGVYPEVAQLYSQASWYTTWGALDTMTPRCHQTIQSDALNHTNTTPVMILRSQGLLKLCRNRKPVICP